MVKKYLSTVIMCFVLSSVISVASFANTGVKIVSKVQPLLLAGLMLTCLSCGPLSDEAFLQRQRLGDSRQIAARVLDLQKTDDNLTGHILAQNHNGHWIVGKIIEQQDNAIHIQLYHQKRLVVVEQREIVGQLIDNHQDVGLGLTWPSEEVGIKHLVGQVFAVYDSNIYAIIISHKLDFSGNIKKLEYDDGSVLKFVHRRNLVIEN